MPPRMLSRRTHLAAPQLNARMDGQPQPSADDTINPSILTYDAQSEAESPTETPLMVAPPLPSLDDFPPMPPLEGDSPQMSSPITAERHMAGQNSSSSHDARNSFQALYTRLDRATQQLRDRQVNERSDPPAARHPTRSPLVASRSGASGTRFTPAYIVNRSLFRPLITGDWRNRHSPQVIFCEQATRPAPQRWIGRLPHPLSSTYHISPPDDRGSEHASIYLCPIFVRQIFGTITGEQLTGFGSFESHVSRRISDWIQWQSTFLPLDESRSSSRLAPIPSLDDTNLSLASSWRGSQNAEPRRTHNEAPRLESVAGQTGSQSSNNSPATERLSRETPFTLYSRPRITTGAEPTSPRLMTQIREEEWRRREYEMLRELHSSELNRIPLNPPSPRTATDPLQRGPRRNGSHRRQREDASARRLRRAELDRILLDLPSSWIAANSLQRNARRNASLWEPREGGPVSRPHSVELDDTPIPLDPPSPRRARGHFQSIISYAERTALPGQQDNSRPWYRPFRTPPRASPPQTPPYRRRAGFRRNASRPTGQVIPPGIGDMAEDLWQRTRALEASPSLSPPWN